MAVHSILFVGAFATSLIAGFFGGRGVYAWLKQRKVEQRTWKDSQRTIAASGLLWKMRNGIKLLFPLARLMLRNRKIQQIMHQAVELESTRGVVTTVEAVCSVMVGLSLILLIAGSVVARTPVCGLALVACLIVGVHSYFRTSREKHVNELRDAIPDALRSLSTCFKSGLTLQQTMQRLSCDVEGPLRSVFNTAALRLSAGCSTSESLIGFREDGGIQELAFVAVALDVQHISGGSISAVLESARESVQSEIDLRRSLKVQTAQAQLSARIVTLMPFALIAVFSLVTEDFLAPFFESIVGMVILGMALSMQLAGVIAIRSILKAEEV